MSTCPSVCADHDAHGVEDPREREAEQAQGDVGRGRSRRWQSRSRDRRRSARPGRAHGRIRVIASAMASAPTAGPPAASRGPVAPTWRMSFANTGSSATAPPRRTPNRSSVIAARNTGVRRTKPKPAKRCDSPRVDDAGGGGPQRHERQTEDEDGLAGGREQVGDEDALRARDEEAADGRPDDRGQLEDRRHPGVRVHELRRGQELGKDGAHGRRGEGARRADEEQTAVDPGGGRAPPRRLGESEGRERMEGVRGHGDAAARDAVRHVPGGDEEDEDRDQLEEADEPERPRIARAAVELPPDGRGEHLAPEHGERAPEREAAHERDAQGGEGVLGRDHRRHAGRSRGTEPTGRGSSPPRGGDEPGPVHSRGRIDETRRGQGQGEPRARACGVAGRPRRDERQVPPCAAATSRAMVRPSPVPGTERARSPRPNGSKIVVCSSAGMPGPSSSTWIARPRSSRSARRQRGRPRPPCPPAFTSRFSTAAGAVRVGAQEHRGGPPTSTGPSPGTSGRYGGPRRRRGLRAGPRLDEAQLPGARPRVMEEVVHEAAHGPRVARARPSGGAEVLDVRPAAAASSSSPRRAVSGRRSS